jgi:opacity protein-like surface antigen
MTRKIPRESSRHVPRPARRSALPRALAAGTLLLGLLLGQARNASADVTAFWGLSPTPATHATKGFAFGLNLLVVGFELEYAHTSERPAVEAPGLHTGMINGLLQTPTRTQLYLTAGAGFYRERLGTETETHFGTNIGGGVKIGLVGPLRLRLDYRIFALRGNPIHANPQRLYAGANLSF